MTVEFKLFLLVFCAMFAAHISGILVWRWLGR